MKNNLLRLAGIGALATGMIFAQTTAGSASATAPQPAQNRQARRARGRNRMANYLNLTPVQREQAKQVMKEAHAQSASLRQQLKQDRAELATAVKSGNDAQIDRLTKSEAPLMAQMAAIRAHAFEKIYATLTPAQKAKADNMRQNFMTHRGRHGRTPQANS